MLNPSDNAAIANLRELFEQEKREIVIERKRFGGRYKASVKQKVTASATIQQAQPWQKSTGPQSAEGKRRSSQNAKIWLTLDYSAKSENELDAVTAPVEAGLKQFREQMSDRGLGCVTTAKTSSFCSRAKNFQIVSTFQRSFQVRLSKWKLENKNAIAELYHECMGELD